jgi:hypothetical protein
LRTRRGDRSSRAEKPHSHSFLPAVNAGPSGAPLGESLRFLACPAKICGAVACIEEGDALAGKPSRDEIRYGALARDSFAGLTRRYLDYYLS